MLGSGHSVVSPCICEWVEAVHLTLAAGSLWRSGAESIVEYRQSLQSELRNGMQSLSKEQAKQGHSDRYTDDIQPYTCNMIDPPSRLGCRKDTTSDTWWRRSCCRRVHATRHNHKQVREVAEAAPQFTYEDKRYLTSIRLALLCPILSATLRPGTQSRA